MIAYVDASVLLRVALAQPNVLPEWSRIQQGVASALVMTQQVLRVRPGAWLLQTAAGSALRIIGSRQSA